MNPYEKMMQDLENKRKEIQRRINEVRSGKPDEAVGEESCSSSEESRLAAFRAATSEQHAATHAAKPGLVSIPMELTHQFWIPIRSETTAALEEIRAAYTFPNPLHKAEKKRRGFSNRPETLSAILVDDPDVGVFVPRGDMRYLIRTLQKNGVNPEITENLPAHPPLDPPYQLKRKVDSEHKRCLHDIRNRRFGIVTGDPGSGRVAFASAWLSEKNVTALVVVREKTQLYEWERALARDLGLSSTTDIALVGDGHAWNPEARITIGIDRSLYRMIDEDFQDSFGVVIVDLVDIATAKIFYEIVGKIRSRYILGISGYRSRDPEHFENQWRHGKGLTGLARAFAGPVLFEWRKKINFWGEGVRVTVVQIDTEFDYAFRDDYKALVTALVRDADRNKRIVDEIVLAAASSAGAVLAVSERKEHLEALDAALRAAHFEPGIIDGDTPAASVDEFQKQIKRGRMKIVLSTTKSIRAAVQAAEFDSVFVATPIKAADHLLTVAIDALGGASPSIYEFADTKTVILMNSLKSRLKLYRELGFAIKDLTCGAS